MLFLYTPCGGGYSTFLILVSAQVLLVFTLGLWTLEFGIGLDYIPMSLMMMTIMIMMMAMIMIMMTAMITMMMTAMIRIMMKKMIMIMMISPQDLLNSWLH